MKAVAQIAQDDPDKQFEAGVARFDESGGNETRRSEHRQKQHSDEHGYQRRPEERLDFERAAPLRDNEKHGDDERGHYGDGSAVSVRQFSLHGAGLNISRQSGDKAQKRDARQKLRKGDALFRENRLGEVAFLVGMAGIREEPSRQKRD